MGLIKIPTTKAQFEKEYYHYSGNNSRYVNSTMIPESESFSIENHQAQRTIGAIKLADAVIKLGPEDFSYDHYERIWIFGFNGDKYYYRWDTKGATIGIFCKMIDPSHKNYLFEPEEYEYQDNPELGEKLLEFAKALAEKIK